MNEDLPAWLWLWFPPVLVIVQYVILIFFPEHYPALIDSELGIIELATPVVLIAGVVAGLRILRLRQRLPRRWLVGWMLLVTLGCVYFAGEELSWGQQLFQWETPETLRALNDQGETNLHNISSWFDQKPRMLLEIGVFIGGIYVPLSRRSRGLGRWPAADPRGWFWPTMVCLPTAVLATAIRLPERIKELMGVHTYPYEIRATETQEYLLGVFLFLYLASVAYRLSRLPASDR